MKRVIRKNVYETNSSSVHSLVISPDGLEPSKLPVDADGYILTDFGTFGTDEKTFSSQADKLSYLITQCYYMNHFDDDLSNSDVFECLEEAICDYTGAKGIRVLGDHEPFIDHQMIPEYDDFNLGVNIYNPDSINNFVFNKYVAFSTDWD